MATIPTVNGPIETAQLGVTLMDEIHVVLGTEIQQNFPDEWGGEDQRIAGAVARLNELKSRGVDTMVDLTVIGLGRYIPRIQKIAERTSINIIVATGIYTYNDVPLYFHLRGPGTVMEGPEIMVDMFVQDIDRGIAGTGVKAGVLKCPTDQPGDTNAIKRVLRATARSHPLTGTPTSTHTHAPSKSGLAQQKIFREEGV